ncbi:MAG TPA: alpha/beta hydrolase [Thermoanaerobaculia bacterium]|jgi:pimeloyl-ACP methyl ester carboxylesterase|nr:alpha/beta hydrolase [Thermoanaerobaculia bacterium]
MDGMSLRHRTIATNGIRLHAVEAGPQDGPLLIFLHGFPELWYGWRQQIAPFAEAGFRVLAPDQRGYNTSDKPKGVRAYGRDSLAQDVLGLIDEAGREKAYVVGHDWGGIAAWWLGMKHPGRIERLAILNCPHPVVMRHHLLKNPRQLKRSWYMFAFQLPWLPERGLRKSGYESLVKALRWTSRRGTFTDEDLLVYREAWAQPGALTAMVNWYRAGLRVRASPPPSPRVTVPTLLIWGTKDRALGEELAQPSIDLCDHGLLARIEEATHWLQHEEPGRVNALIGDFFS